MALNLGGIANISFDRNGKRQAFDICPFNMVLNDLAAEANLKFDDRGLLASQGKVQKNLFYQLNEISYLSKNAPKSLGLEDYLSDWQPLLRKSGLSLEDKMATCVEHLAHQISLVIRQANKAKVLVTGGGAYHDFFISRLRNFTLAEIVIPNQDIIEFKEALVFAYLGLLRLQNIPNCLSSVTGAPFDVCGGEIIGL